MLREGEVAWHWAARECGLGRFLSGLALLPAIIRLSSSWGTSRA